MSDDITPNDHSESESSSKGFGIFRELKRRKIYRVAVTYLVVGWLIVQVANATFGEFGIPIWAYRFVVLMLVLGFPVAIILAWAFELTPDGIRTVKVARQEQGKPDYHPEHNRKRNWMAYGMGALLPTLIFGSLALFFYFKLPSPGDSAHTGTSGSVIQLEKSIAVLPFENRSNQEEDKHFTDGVHDDLLTLISRIKEIKTISRTSVMGYADSPKPMPQIGQELGVSYILEGGVQRAGTHVRINVQLIDAARDDHVWAEIYDRELTAEDVFKIQSEITQNIADTLRAVISPEEQESIEQQPTENLTALEMYYEARARRSLGTSDGLARAIPFLQVAIDLDPDFAEAYVALAQCYHSQVWTSGFLMNAQWKKAEPLIIKALELDPNLGSAHSALGALLRFKQDYEGAEVAFRKSIELSPNNPDVITNFAFFLTSWNFQQYEEAISMMDQAIELDPENILYVVSKGSIAILGDRYDEAETLLKSVIDSEAESPAAYKNLADLSAELGRYDQAIINYWKAFQLDPGNPGSADGLWRAYLNLDLPQQTIYWIQKGQEVNPDGTWAKSREIYSHIVKGNYEEANTLWWKYHESNHVWVSHFDMMFKDIEEGRLDLPLKRYIALDPGLYKHLTEIGPEERARGGWRAKDIALALIVSGKQKEGLRILERLNAQLQKDGYQRNTDSTLHAIILTLMGKPDEAIACLKNVKVYTNWGAVPGRHPNLKNLRGIPEFDAINDPLEARWKAQREQVLKWEKTGELPETNQ